jgi:hypothetical protein
MLKVGILLFFRELHSFFTVNNSFCVAGNVVFAVAITAVLVLVAIPSLVIPQASSTSAQYKFN